MVSDEDVPRPGSAARRNECRGKSSRTGGQQSWGSSQSFRQEATSILRHYFDKKNQLKVVVRWMPDRVDMPEDVEAMLDLDPRAVDAYIKHLAQKSKKSFNCLLREYPEILTKIRIAMNRGGE